MKLPRVGVLRHKYARIGIAALVVFVVVGTVEGPAAGAFWAGVTAAVVFILSFDPRIKRHW